MLRTIEDKIPSASPSDLVTLMRGLLPTQAELPSGLMTRLQARSLECFKDMQLEEMQLVLELMVNQSQPVEEGWWQGATARLTDCLPGADMQQLLQLNKVTTAR